MTRPSAGRVRRYAAGSISLARTESCSPPIAALDGLTLAEAERAIYFRNALRMLKM
jgi:hypothetical protein